MLLLYKEVLGYTTILVAHWYLFEIVAMETYFLLTSFELYITFVTLPLTIEYIPALAHSITSLTFYTVNQVDSRVLTVVLRRM